MTSAAYLVAAAWLWQRSGRVRPGQRWRGRMAAGVSAATGVGSIAYHGAGGRTSHLLHDTSMLLLLAWSPIGTRRWPRDARDRRALRRRRQVAGAATAVGLAGYVLGRTDAPTCRPTSRWQWHGLWHVAGAVATAAWSDAVDVLPHLEPVRSTDGTPG